DELWIEKYKPTTEIELAVHKKKVAEVRCWLLEQLTSKPSNAILLLTGPVGAGKTATIHMLQTELSFEIQEWINPLVTTDEVDYVKLVQCLRSNFNFMSYQSQLSQFKEFLLRANKYPTLSIFGTSTDAKPRKVILVEDLPNIFFRDSKKFHEVLQSYQSAGRSPVVLIISDSHHGDSNVHRLLPKSVQESLGVTSISFNPIARTSLVKTLNRIASSENQKAGREFVLPGKEAIEGLAQSSTGDIRTAINALQFSCLRGNNLSLLKKTKSGTSVQKTSWQNRLSEDSSRAGQDSGEPSVLSAIGGRDSSIFLFRALGKILYCKRDPVTSDKDLLPPHLTHCARNTPQFCPEEVAERAHLSSELLQLYLHQNYLDFFTDLDSVVIALEYMSDADMMSAVWMHRSLLVPYMASIATRGLMFANARYGPTPGFSAPSRGGWRPLHKPQWFEINKRMRDSKQAARALFPDHASNATVLHTEILPYLAITDAPLKTPGQIEFLQQIGRLQRGRSSNRYW
ncbi:predicted protein, partial [Nematostella vectensis]